MCTCDVCTPHPCAFRGRGDGGQAPTPTEAHRWPGLSSYWKEALTVPGWERPAGGPFSATARGSPTPRQALLWPWLPSACPGGGLRAKAGPGRRGSIPERTGHVFHVPVLVKDISRAEREGLGVGFCRHCRWRGEGCRPGAERAPRRE